jgi:hypothetical protein
VRWRRRGNALHVGSCNRHRLVRRHSLVIFCAAEVLAAMRLRQWIGLVAMLGVLLHAGLIVRHNTVMLAAGLEQAVFDQGAICHGGRTPTASKQPLLPEQERPNADCPMCMGLVSALAILGAAPADQPCREKLAMRLADVTETIALRLAAPRPPSRGPPRPA